MIKNPFYLFAKTTATIRQVLLSWACLPLMALLLIGIISPVHADAAKKGDILATGDGFVISKKDLFRFQIVLQERVSFYNEDPKAQLQAAVRTWVFAEEAKQLGYEKKFEDLGKPLSTDPVEKRLQLFFIYRRKLLQDYPIEERLILSFFRSYAELQEPLDENMREQIHAKIVAARVKKIVEEESLVLIAKYNVKILGQDESQ